MLSLEIVNRNFLRARWSNYCLWNWQQYLARLILGHVCLRSLLPIARSQRLCLSTSRDHGLGLPDGYRASIIRVLIDIDLEIAVVGLMLVYYRGNLGERVVLMMKMLTQRWTTVRWTF